MARRHSDHPMFLKFLFVSAVLWTLVYADTGSLKPRMSKAEHLFFYGKNAGDTPIDDISNPKDVDLPFNISFFGSSYKHLYISKDGLLGFEEGIRYVKTVWSEGLASQSFDKPFIAPFYHDGYLPVGSVGTYKGKIYWRLIDQEVLAQSGDDPDTHNSENQRMLTYLSEYIPGAVVNAPKEFDCKLAVLVTWEDVTDSAEGDLLHDDPEYSVKSATFQAVVASDKENTFIIFNYNKMEIPITGPYQAGFNGGHGRGWYNVIPCQEACAVNLNASRVNDLATLKGSDTQGRFILNVGHEVIVRGGCLPTDLHAGTLEVFPRDVGMFGGELLEVSGKCLPIGSKIHCKFTLADQTYQGDLTSFETVGQMRNDMRGYCPVPIMTWKGPTLVSWSADGEEWSAFRTIDVDLPGSLSKTVAVDESILAEWYSRDADTITVVWDPSIFTETPGATVNVRLLGYREDSVTEEVDVAALKDLENKVDITKGSLTVKVEDHRCKRNCEKYEQGMLEVSLPEELYPLATKRVAVRFGPITLGWYVNEELTKQRGSGWSNEKCKEWHSQDSADETWLTQLEPCPCSLNQALADFGRFRADPGCNLYGNTQCYFHKAAKHCVRSVVPTSHGSGNQCCYDAEGTLIYSQLSYEGSSPDRSHSTGSSPFSRSDRVPVLSHWKHDVVPYYYCCLWNENELCDHYIQQRPTPDCLNYDVPGIAFLRGDPHITTFGGHTYNFGGYGDFWLLQSVNLAIQGRFEPILGSWEIPTPTGSWKPTALTRLAMQGLGTKAITIRSAPERALQPRGLDILVHNERKFFFTKATMVQDFGSGLTIINNAPVAENNRHDNFTILFADNCGVNVFSANGLLHVTVALPPTLRKQNADDTVIKGLFGTYVKESDNDFLSAEGSRSAPGQDPKVLYDTFAMSWQVAHDYDSLFTFRMPAKDITEYVPYFSYEDIPSTFDGAPAELTITNTCSDNANCKWDYRITGNANIAKSTKEGDAVFAFKQSAAYKVENCGLPEVGPMAVMDHYNFSLGKEVKVIGCYEGKTFSGDATFRCEKVSREAAKDRGSADYGRTFVEEKDNTKQIIQWYPEPYTVCAASVDESNIALIVGIVVGCLIGVILIAVVIIFIIKRKTGSASPSKKASSRTKTSGTDKSSREVEAMLEGGQERSPVYRPSTQSVEILPRKDHHDDDDDDAGEPRRVGSNV